MHIRRRVGLVLATALLVGTAFAQRSSAGGGTASRDVRFHVVVTTSSGQCVTDLHERDFRVFDNNSEQAITFFRAVLIRPPRAQETPHRIDAGADQEANGCYARGALFQYEIGFNVPDHAAVNEYRSVGIRVDRPKLRVRTRQGYYVAF
jgi:hypothetical protein